MCHGRTTRLSDDRRFPRPDALRRRSDSRSNRSAQGRTFFTKSRKVRQTEDRYYSALGSSWLLIGVTSVTDSDSASDQELLEEVVAALASIASRAKELPRSVATIHALEQADRALTQILSVITRVGLLQSAAPSSTSYQLIDTDLHDMLVLLLGRRPVMVALRQSRSEDATLHLVMCLMQANGSGKLSRTSSKDVFIAIGGAGHGIIPLSEGIPVERVRNSLGLTLESAATVADLVTDLARAQASFS